MKLIQLVAILALLILQQSSASNDVIRQVADRLGSIVGQLHDEHHRESFDCWFYCSASTAYGDNLLDNVLVSDGLQGVPLIHVSSAVSSVSQTIPHPRLIVVLLDTLEQVR